jgi:hypothetical protein
VAIKELYEANADDTIPTEPTGWAVSVKTAADSGTKGEGWYWYEAISATDPTQFFGDANGSSFCAPCHSGTAYDPKKIPAIDYVKTPYPLQ